VEQKSPGAAGGSFSTSQAVKLPFFPGNAPVSA
jgi:hypothetical protein